MRKTLVISALVGLLLAVTVPMAFASGGTYHKVYYGETLFSIGRQYHVYPYRIASVNNLDNPNHIYAGQVLYIPESDGYNDGCSWNGCNNHQGDHNNGCSWNNCNDNNSDYNNGCSWNNCNGNRTDYNNGCSWNGCNDYQVGYDYGCSQGCNNQRDGYNNNYQMDYRHGGSDYHRVQRGETLSQIAYYYGVSPWAIAQANHIYNLNRIYVGQLLHIPSGYSNY